MTLYQDAGYNELTLFRVVKDERNGFNAGDICWLAEDDGSNVPYFSGLDVMGRAMSMQFELEELPKDEDGFYLWGGGDWPVPWDWEVQVKLRQGGYAQETAADKLRWDHYLHGDGSSHGYIVAFKPISRPDMPRHSEGENLAETPVVVDNARDISGDIRALDVQEGGDHYKKLKIQPMEYSMANNLDACQHTIIKYVTRFRDKGGIEDLRKAKHCIDMLIEFEAEALEGGE